MQQKTILYIDIIDGITFTLDESLVSRLIDGLDGVESDAAITYRHPQGTYVIVVVK